MTIGLLVEYLDGEEIGQYHPIATREVFNRYWVPIFTQNNYKWLPLFETGASFNQEDLPFILNELKSFKEELILHREVDIYSYEHVFSRVNQLLDSLVALEGHQVKFFIG
jgi:hypothetical protein